MNKFEKISKDQFFEDCWIEVFGSSKQDCNMPLVEQEETDAWLDKLSLPKRATTDSAGYDFFAPYDIKIRPRCTVKVPTGIRVILDNDKFLAIYPRSGLGFKYKMQLYNSVGIIDSDYIYSDNEGHIWCKFYNDSPDGKTITIKQGEAMCQGIIQQFFKTVDDETDGIRNGGMGSTTR